MAMAVVEQAAPQHVPHSPYKQLGLASLAGAIYVLFALIFVFGLLPTIWDEVWGITAAAAAGLEPPINPFLSGVLLLITMIVVGAAIWWLGMQLDRQHAQPGLRAGIFFGAVAITIVLWLVTKIGHMMASDEGNVIGMGFAGIMVAGFGFLIAWLFSQPGFARWLGRVEDAGWFHAVPYKGNQGVRVRRGTILGLLIVGLCGIYSLVSGGALGVRYRGTTDWFWEIPFSRTQLEGAEGYAYTFVPLVYNVNVVVPILLALALMWLCWRVVNWPTFADFLIATEAEINKVSWTTRRRLVQDTIVVLATVFLMTAFLFVVDIIWIKVLTHPWVSVLQVDIKSEFQKQQQKTQW